MQSTMTTHPSTSNNIRSISKPPIKARSKESKAQKKPYLIRIYELIADECVAPSCLSNIYDESEWYNNYLLTESEVFTVKYYRAIARSIRQDRGLIFYRKDRAVEVNK